MWSSEILPDPSARCSSAAAFLCCLSAARGHDARAGHICTASPFVPSFSCASPSRILSLWGCSTVSLSLFPFFPFFFPVLPHASHPARAGGGASASPAHRLPLPHGNAPPPAAHWLPAAGSPPPAARHAPPAPLAAFPKLICMAPRAPMGGRCLLNMQGRGQSAGEGAGPPRAVAKLRLLNCYYTGSQWARAAGICQHPLPRRGGGSDRHWPALLLSSRPAPVRRSPLAARAARPLCVKCRCLKFGGSGVPARELCAGGSGQAAMELNSLLILLEAAEYLERRDRGTGRRRAVGQAPAGAPSRSRPLLCGGRAGAAAPSPHLPGGDPGCAGGTALGEHRRSDRGFLKSLSPQARQKGLFVPPWMGPVRVAALRILSPLRVWQSVIVWQLPSPSAA